MFWITMYLLWAPSQNVDSKHQRGNEMGEPVHTVPFDYGEQ